MASYYYLMSSLPMLRSDGEMPFSYEKFLAYCKDTVSESKYKLLENLTVDSTEGPLVCEWAKFYGEYKAELNFKRNARLNKKSEQPFGTDSKIAHAVSAAIEEKNPLNAEKALLMFQFEKLDGLIGTHSFDDYSLFGYAIKLKLLERKTVFDEKKGKKELNRLVSELERQIESIH